MVLCCAVKGCKREAYPGSGVPFHRIPVNRRDLWIAAMKLDSNVSKFACICGKHFKEEDYITPLKSKLKPEAVPSILNPKMLLNPFEYITPYISRSTENNNDEYKPSEIDYFESDVDDTNDQEASVGDQEASVGDQEASVGDQADSDESDTTYCSDVSRSGSREKLRLDGLCRTCLCNDRTLCDISTQDELTFQDVFNAHDSDWQTELPCHVCWECSARLNSFTAFKAKAKRANAVLVSLIRSNTRSTDLLTLREEHNLTSSLVTKTLHNDFADYYMEQCAEEETDLKPILDLQQIVDNLDIGQEICVPFTDIQNLEMEQEDIQNVLTVPEIVQNTLKVSVSNIVQKPKKIQKTRKRNLNEYQENCETINELDSDIFDVKYLSTEEQLNEIIDRQHSDNYKNAGFKCNECYKGFVYEEAFNLHMIKHSDQNGTYCCGVCKVRYVKKQDLRRHMLQHMQKFSCKKCDYVTSIRHSAKLHEKYHSGTKYECPHCLENFAKKTTFMNHLRIKHPSDIVCTFCGHCFVSQKGLQYHVKRKHRFHEHTVPEDGPWCMKCDIQFYNTEALEKHLQLSDKHSKDELKPRKPAARRFYSWQESGNQSGTRVRRKRIALQSTAPITCEQCDAQLGDARAYFVHFRRQHPDKNRTRYAMKSQTMCEVCGKMFQSAAALRNHSFTHEETKQFRCSVCDKQFVRQTGLHMHTRLMHAHNKPSYSCNICSKTFTNASNLQRHRAIHTGLKPHQCEICGKLFKDKREKRAHIEYVHLKKPRPKRVRRRRKEVKQNLPQSTPLAITKGQPVKIYIIRRK